MVYLLHFETKYHHAQHYIGFCEEGNLDKRIEQHKRGEGSRLVKAVYKLAGIKFYLARIWPGEDKAFEYKLKKQKNSKRFCPLCKGKKEI